MKINSRWPAQFDRNVLCCIIFFLYFNDLQIVFILQLKYPNRTLD